MTAENRIALLRRAVELAERIRRNVANNVAEYGPEAYKLADEIERDARADLAAFEEEQLRREATPPGPSTETCKEGK